MIISKKTSLKKYNTFGIDAAARYFSSFSSVDELEELIGDSGNLDGRDPLFILGGGSNILFTKDYDGLVLKNEMKGIDVVAEDEHHVYVRVGAGENWNEFVQYCLKRNWAGVENLSLIPGNTGAGPMQNIGAYGVELKDVFHELEAFDISRRKVVMFTLNDCAFGYRDSIFKHKEKDRFIILTVTFRLNKAPIFHTGYGAITEELERMGVSDLSIKAVSQAVINIRRSKLPDPAVIGNAGSFFKNPEIPLAQFRQLQAGFPGIPGYPAGGGLVKLAAGWMIEQCGWKGFRRGDAGCHEKQALVLVNFGKATGEELFALSEEILQSVGRKFGVNLQREVNIV